MVPETRLQLNEEKQQKDMGLDDMSLESFGAQISFTNQIWEERSFNKWSHTVFIV